MVANDEVGVFYDPMIAKLIVWGEDRATAIQRLQQALGDYCIAGLTTNINFLTRLSGHSAFRSAQLSTDFIEQFAGDLLALDEEEVQRHGLLVCLYEALRAGHVESGCPWQGRDNWRMNAESAQTTALLIDGVEQYITTVAESASGFRMSLNDKDYWVTGELRGNRLVAVVDGHRQLATVVADALGWTVFGSNQSTYVGRVQTDLGQELTHDDGTHYKAPMNGTVVDVLVNAARVIKWPLAIPWSSWKP